MKNTPEYEPFGAEWERELLKLPKAIIAKFLEKEPGPKLKKSDLIKLVRDQQTSKL